ncbi:hypothetical protein ACWD04_31990 [Streptomyces sp. NPDC002911]
MTHNGGSGRDESRSRTSPVAAVPDDGTGLLPEATGTDDRTEPVGFAEEAAEKEAAAAKSQHEQRGSATRHADLALPGDTRTAGRTPVEPKGSRNPASPGAAPASPGDKEASIPERADAVITGTHVIAPGGPVYAGGAQLSMESDGNFVVRDSTGVVRWAANTATLGDRAVFQGDGNLVVVAADGRSVWSSGTAGNPGARLVLQETGRLLIRSAGGAVLWSAGSPG